MQASLSLSRSYPSSFSFFVVFKATDDRRPPRTPRVNDVGFESNYLNGPADLYGWDGYPQGFDCSIPDDWHALPDTWQKDHARLDRGRPSYTPEFQGGAFDPWGGVGYRNCARLTGAEFERVFYQGGLWASNVKMMSLYMLYGASLRVG